MTNTGVSRAPRLLRLTIGPLASRPRLGAALGLGILVAIALSVFPNHLSWSTRAILSWDALWACFLGSTFIAMMDCNIERIQARAAEQDEGQHAILALALIAAAISIGAIAAELSLAKADHGLVKGLRIGLAFLTVAGSWLFVQTVFALHYAHEYYAASVDPKSAEVQGGLAFPGGELPDYWDFLHFAVVIGVAAQTADVAFTSKGLRRVGTIHGVVAFTFNTVVLALTINLLAGLF
jgi:uncharacterized membrane protein